MDISRIPVRMRLSLWYLATFFFALVLFGAGTFYAMRASVEHQFDRDLRMRLAGIGRFLDEGHNVKNVRHELEENAELRPGGELLQIELLQTNEKQGQWVFQSDSMRRLGIRMPADSSSERAVFATVSANRVPIRLLTAFKSVRGDRYGIQIAQSLAESSELIQRFGWILIGAIPIVLLVAAVSGYWMARRALQPVITITEDARAISALDISKRIAIPPANDELRNLSKTLNEMMDRLETAFRRVTQFTADASHELRTPVALIRTTAELALVERSPRASIDALSSILQESERTTELLEDLLVMARADSNLRVRLENLDITTPIRQAISQAEVLAASKGISISFFPDQACVIDGNRELLRRLFLILIDNSIKYSAAGGHVAIAIQKQGESVQVEVRDKGIGISADDLPHIFERFYRADKARDRSGGAGLGLSIAEWIAKTHHARIGVSSVIDQGTTVTVRFPLVANSVTPSTRSAATADSLSL